VGGLVQGIFSGIEENQLDKNLISVNKLSVSELLVQKCITGYQ
jgi:hypothetical protein